MEISPHINKLSLSKCGRCWFPCLIQTISLPPYRSKYIIISITSKILSFIVWNNNTGKTFVIKGSIWIMNTGFISVTVAGIISINIINSWTRCIIHYTNMTVSIAFKNNDVTFFGHILSILYHAFWIFNTTGVLNWWTHTRNTGITWYSIRLICGCRTRTYKICTPCPVVKSGKICIFFPQLRLCYSNNIWCSISS